MSTFPWKLLVVLWLWPLAAWAGEVDLRVERLAAAPAMPAPAAVVGTGGESAPASRVWLLPRARTEWFALRLATDWRADDTPLLVIHGNIRARMTVYLPPDYRPRNANIFAARFDPTLSHHSVVYALPAHLRADQPIYAALGDPGQSQPVRLQVIDATSYRVADLWHVRASVAFAMVQVSMALVILCFWIVLRDRMFLWFIAYVATQTVYDLSVSGELFALPDAQLLAPLGYHTGQSMGALAVAFSIWFLLDFADLRRGTPRLARVLRWLRWPFLALATAVWMPWLHPDMWLAYIVNYLLVGTCVIVLAAGWLAWRRGNREAGYFLLAWVPLLLLTIARVGQLIVGFRWPGWLEYGFPASMAWSAVIITVGLADRTLQARQQRDAATRSAEFDPLTGVFNRGAITRRLQLAWQATASADAPLAVLFLDIDHFKRINDSYGHAAGDACLRAVTDAVRAELGDADHIGRYGGEEFLLVLRGEHAWAAVHVAERIVARAAALSVAVGECTIALTVSIGVAVRDAGTPSADALVARADAAQYRAKAEGRNRVVA